ncbi:MAG: DUF167 family protein [Pseudomonadota bacterium]|nr:DUF167 family protein [Pseudomonadota bacterium]
MSANGPECFERTADGIRLFVRLTPKSSADRVDGVADQGDGSLRLKVRVRAVPEDGKANAALGVLLAKTFDVAKSDVTLVTGATNRSKTLVIAGDPDKLAEIAASLSRS